MEIINPWLLYLVLQADSIKSMATHLSMWASVLTVVVLVAWGGYILVCTMEAATSYSSSRAEEYLRRRAVALRKWGVPGAVVVLASGLSLASSMIPTTKSAAMLLVIPTIANSEVVQAEARELYDLAKQGLKELVDEPTAQAAESFAGKASAVRAEGGGE